MFHPPSFARWDGRAAAGAVWGKVRAYPHPAQTPDMLAALMGAQAGLPPLDFGGMQGKGKPRYIAAIHAGIAQNYKPMVEVFRRALKKTLAA